MKNTNFAKSHLLADEVDVDLDVLGTMVVDCVGCHVDSANIVAVDNCGNLQRNVELLKKLPQLAALGDNMSNRLVLGLRTGPGYRGLPFGRPVHQVVSQEDTET